jgi:hypothetical protein
VGNPLDPGELGGAFRNALRLGFDENDGGDHALGAERSDRGENGFRAGRPWANTAILGCEWGRRRGGDI